MLYRYFLLNNKAVNAVQTKQTFVLFARIYPPVLLRADRPPSVPVTVLLARTPRFPPPLDPAPCRRWPPPSSGSLVAPPAASASSRAEMAYTSNNLGAVKLGLFTSPAASRESSRQQRVTSPRDATGRSRADSGKERLVDARFP